MYAKLILKRSGVGTIQIASMYRHNHITLDRLREERFILPDDDNVPLARWRRNRYRPIHSRLLVTLCQIGCLFLILLPLIVVRTDAYARTYLALAHRYHWNQSGSNWGGKDLTDSDFSGMRFSNAGFDNASLRQVNFSDADLKGADLKFAALKGANFDGGNLSGAALVDCDLTGAKFGTADLTDADLSACTLKDVDLSRTKLHGCYLHSANLSSVRLPGANLTGVHYDNETIWPQGFIPEKHHEMINDDAPPSK